MARFPARFQARFQKRRAVMLLHLLLINALLATLIALLAWWLRDRRLKAQRETLRIFHGLSEDIIAAPTPAAIAEKLALVLPAVTQATSVNLYLFQRRTKSLERIPTSADPEPMAASIEAPPEGLANAAVVCFRNRALLNIPDVRRNPLVKIGPKMSLPRSAMFVPLHSQQETLGVLEVGNARRTVFSRRKSRPRCSTWPTRQPRRLSCRNARPCESSFSTAKSWPPQGS